MKKNLISKTFVTGLIILFIGASIFPIVNAKEIKNRKQNPPQPSPFEITADFNITFYQPSSMTIKRFIFNVFPFSWYIGRFSVIDFSNNPVGKIKYIEQSTGSETAKTFTFFMVGFFLAGYADDSHYNESTGLGYIWGKNSLLFYFGL